MILLWKEMCVDKNRIFDIDLLFVSPELQTVANSGQRNFSSGGKLRITRELP